MTRQLNQMHILLQCVCYSYHISFDLTWFKVLHPRQKLKHFKKHWSPALIDEVTKMAEAVVSEDSQIVYLLNNLEV